MRRFLAAFLARPQPASKNRSVRHRPLQLETLEDRTVPAGNQRRLADAVPDSVSFEVDGPHDSIVTRTNAYLPVLLDAVATVTGSPE